MYHNYPILKFFVTAQSDAARYSYIYRCRVCLVELSLMTKGPIEIPYHCRPDAHRIRMETPGLRPYDKHCNELTGDGSQVCQGTCEAGVPNPSKIGDYYLRVDKLEQSDQVPAEVSDEKISSDLNLVRFVLVHAGHLEPLLLFGVTYPGKPRQLNALPNTTGGLTAFL